MNWKSVKCRVCKYDPACTKPPYTLLELAEIEMDELSSDAEDPGGDIRAAIMRSVTKQQTDYNMKFFTSSSEKDRGFTYDIVVH